METNKILPWVLIGALALGAVWVFKSNQPSGPGPWNPPGPVQPFNPNGPAPYCPVCPKCERCDVIERAFNQEKYAMRRELARTQLNVAQAARDIGRTQPMKVADWLFYTPNFYAGDASATGSGPDAKFKIEAGSGPTEDPTTPAGK